jgi:hypothetical protein
MMRRLSAPRVSAAVAVVATIVAVLTVMSPGLGFGQEETFFSHGGPPEVYTQTHPGDVCVHVDSSTGTQVVMAQEFTIEVPSNVTAYFSSRIGLLQPREVASLSFGLDPFQQPEWGFTASGNTTAKYFGGQTSGMIMWTYDHVAPGAYLLQTFARVSGGSLPSADFNQCALTVFVSPVEE